MVSESSNKYVVLDTETKNLGSDIMRDNEQLLTIQLGNSTKQELYYYDSRNPKLTLEIGKRRIESLLSQDVTFVGYYFKGFDIPMLGKFLGIDVPLSNVLELTETTRIRELHRIDKNWTMEHACANCGIEATHKKKMKELAEKYKTKPEIMKRASADAEENTKKKGGTFQWWYEKMLSKLARGHAIWEAYSEFAESGGRRDTLFYEYAIGDIVATYELFKKLGLNTQEV